MNCASLETIAAWTLGELDDASAAAFEEHYFSCDSCFDRAEKLQRVHRKLERALPGVLNRARTERLARAAPSLVTVRVAPGERAHIELGGARPFGIWVMNAPLAGVERVDLEASAGDGTPLFSLADVPFDRERGEVVLACQVHYRDLPIRDLRVRLTKVDAEGAQPLAEYVLEHTFDSV